MNTFQCSRQSSWDVGCRKERERKERDDSSQCSEKSTAWVFEEKIIIMRDFEDGRSAVKRKGTPVYPLPSS